MKKIILSLILWFFVSFINSSFLSSNKEKKEGVEEEHLIISDFGYLTYKLSSAKDENFILSYTMDRNNKSNLGLSDKVKHLSTKLNVVVDELNKNSLNVTKDNENVIVNNRYSYIHDNILSIVGKAINEGYIFLTHLGLPYLTGSFNYAKKDNSKAVLKSINGLVLNKNNKPVYVFTGDWMFNSVYKKNFTAVDIVSIDDGYKYFNGNDYKANSDDTEYFFVGDDVQPYETSITKVNDLYIVTYFGLPLYISKDGSDIQGKEANNGRYYTINFDGTVNFSKDKRIKVYTNDFELYFNGTNKPDSDDSKSSSSRISYGFQIIFVLLIYLAN